LDISCIILAGGKSLRLGHDKITEKVGNTTLLEKVISRIDSLCKDIVIVTAEERSFAESGDNPKIKTVSDIFPGRGSLGGIYTGLVKTEAFYNFVIVFSILLILLSSHQCKNWEFLLRRKQTCSRSCCLLFDGEGGRAEK